MPDPEPKAWTLANTIMAAMGAVIMLLLTLGFYSQNTKIEVGDRLIREEIAAGNKAAMDQIKEIKEQYKDTSNCLVGLVRDVSRIDANQKARMDRERVEHELQIRNGKPR